MCGKNVINLLCELYLGIYSHPLLNMFFSLFVMSMMSCKVDEKY